MLQLPRHLDNNRSGRQFNSFSLSAVFSVFTRSVESNQNRNFLDEKTGSRDLDVHFWLWHLGSIENTLNLMLKKFLYPGNSMLQLLRHLDDDRPGLHFKGFPLSAVFSVFTGSVESNQNGSFLDEETGSRTQDVHIWY
jgi:hypothetical protein